MSHSGSNSASLDPWGFPICPSGATVGPRGPSLCPSGPLKFRKGPPYVCPSGHRLGLRGPCRYQCIGRYLYLAMEVFNSRSETSPRSSVRLSLARAWWLSATGYVADFRAAPRERWPSLDLGTSPGIAPGLASHTATVRSPGRQPFWLSHLLHPMALQWPEGAERALSHQKPKPQGLRGLF